MRRAVRVPCVCRAVRACRCRRCEPGKYSFFPASTHLWRLNDREVLRDSYDWTKTVLETYGLDCPPCPDLGGDGSDEEPKDTWFLKSYPSYYIPLDQRLRMTRDLHTNAERPSPPSSSSSSSSSAADKGGDRGDFVLDCMVEGWRYDEVEKLFRFDLRRRPPAPDGDGAAGERVVLTARYAIFAGGRFFPMLMAKEDKCPMRFMRVEVGLRIEDASDNPFFTEIGTLPRSTMTCAAVARGSRKSSLTALKPTHPQRAWTPSTSFWWTATGPVHESSGERSAAAGTLQPHLTCPEMTGR